MFDFHEALVATKKRQLLDMSFLTQLNWYGFRNKLQLTIIHGNSSSRDIFLVYDS